MKPCAAQLNEGLKLYTKLFSGCSFLTSDDRYLAVDRLGDDVSTHSISAYGANIFARAIAAYVTTSLVEVDEKQKKRRVAHVFSAGVVIVALPRPRN